MDGLSAAASGMAVVSLAIQLIQATQNIRDFFKDFVGAPEEVRRLEQDLVQLASILQDVQVVTEMQLTQRGAPNPRASLLASLTACGEKLLLIQTFVDSAKEKLRKSGRVSRHWESFKLVFKKKDIEKFEANIHQAMQSLTASMAMNLTVLNLTGLLMITNTAQAPSRRLLTSTSSTQDPTIRRSISKEGCPKLVNIRKTSALVKFSSYNGQNVWTVSVRKNTRGSKFMNDDQEGCLTKEYVLNISSTTLGYYMSLVLRSSHWSISSGIQVDPVADSHDPIFLMCIRGDIAGVQMAFSKRKVSPFVRDQDGNTLLHHAAFVTDPNLVRLLLQCGVDARKTDNWGRTPLHYATGWSFRNSIATIDTFRVLINHGRNDLTEEDDMGRNFLNGYTGMSEPYIWGLKQEEFQIVSPQAGHLPFHSIAKSFAYLCFSHYGRTNFQSHGWESAVQRLLHLGVPLSPLIPGTVTALDILLNHADYAVDSSPLADAWLSLLASVGVDIEEYVAREKILHPSGFVYRRWPENQQEGDVQKRLIFEEGESKCPRIRWEWYYDVESPAHVALNEFSGFCRPYFSSSWPWTDKWPFQSVEDHKGLNYPMLLNIMEREVYDSKMATLEARWARQAFRRYQRSQYSPRQIKPSRSEKRCRVPGAWVEDPFQTPYNFRHRRRSSLLWWPLYLLASAVAFLTWRSSLFPPAQISMLDRMKCENSDW